MDRTGRAGGAGRRRARLPAWMLLALALCMLPGCRSTKQEEAPAPADFDAVPVPTPVTPTQAAPPGPGETEIIDAHLHLLGGTTNELVAALDRNRIARAAILATPHLDPEIRRSSTSLAGYQEANEIVLAAAAAYPARLVPFVTVDLGETEPAYLAGLLDRGACGVKIYQGHRSLRERPLDDARHRPLFALLEARGTPVLLHVNTVHFRDELARLLRAFPALEVVCAHFCGSRTDLDRLAGLLRDFPRLRVDTSHGAGVHGAAGFAHLEGERERLRAMIEAEPARFLFGSDLVTEGEPETRQADWDMQIEANLGLLTRPHFRFWRRQAGSAVLLVDDYQGIVLSDAARGRVLGDNARAWLAGCLRDAP